MKWGQVHPQANKYKFIEAEYIADFARSNNKRLYGHDLLRQSYNPDWLTIL